VLQIIPDATVAADQGGRILAANLPFETLFGHSIQELIGRPIEMLVPESLRDAHRAHRASLIASEGIWRPMGRRRPLPAIRKDGTQFPADISLFSLVTTGGSSRGSPAARKPGWCQSASSTPSPDLPTSLA
jgi:PAS domain S-box-containing protein